MRDSKDLKQFYLQKKSKIGNNNNPLFNKNNSAITAATSRGEAIKQRKLVKAFEK